MSETHFSILSQIHPFNDINSSKGISVLCCNPVETGTIACGSSDGDVCLIDLSKNLVTQRCLGHEKAITDISFSSLDPNLLFSSSRDGTVSLFDSRLPPHVCRISKVRLTLENDDADVWSVDGGGTSECLLACSKSDKILIYDIRIISDTLGINNRKLKRSDGLSWVFKDFHTDIINCVRFHPSKRSLLLSGADDNLLCMYNTDKCHENYNKENLDKNSPDNDNDDDNDETFIGCVNTDSPPRLLRILGPQQSVICAISTIETIQAWHWVQPQSITFDDAVTKYTSSFESPFPSTRTHSVSDPDFLCHRIIPPTNAIRDSKKLIDGDSTGYIVNVVYDEATERLFTIGGSCSGGLVLFHTNQFEVDPFSLFLTNDIFCGHKSVVRCCDIITSFGPVFVSGSEDGSLCLWKQ